MIDEEKLEQRILTVNEDSAKKIIEEILLSNSLEASYRADENDFKGKDYLKQGCLRQAIIRKTFAGKGYELWQNNLYAGYSFDRGAKAAFDLDWYNITLLLHERAFGNYLKTDKKEEQIFSSSWVAVNYLRLDNKEKAEEFLAIAFRLASEANYNLSECIPFKKAKRKLESLRTSP